MDEKNENESNKSAKGSIEEKEDKNSKIEEVQKKANSENENEIKIRTEKIEKEKMLIEENEPISKDKNLPESTLNKSTEKEENQENGKENKEIIDEKNLQKLQEEEIKNMKLIPKPEYIIAVIHNITPNVTEDHLKEIFSHFGEVKECYIPINKQTQLKKNYAFIEFTKLENAEKAQLYMDEGQIDGKVINVEILAKKKLCKT